MIACPSCASVSLSDNKFQSVEFSHIAGDAFVATRNGRGADALSNVIAWVGVWAANLVRKPYRCDHCGQTF